MAFKCVTGYSPEIKEILTALGLQDLQGLTGLTITINPSDLVRIELEQVLNQEQAANLGEVIERRSYALVQLLDEEPSANCDIDSTTPAAE